MIKSKIITLKLLVSKEVNLRNKKAALERDEILIIILLIITVIFLLLFVGRGSEAIGDVFDSIKWSR